MLLIQVPLMAAQPVTAATNAPSLLARMRPGHPRLLATGADFARLRVVVRDDADARRACAALRGRGIKLLDEAPSRYDIPDGVRLLATSRQVLDRMLTLGLLYRLDGDRRWADRAWRELEAAAAFRDWNPSHFLDTAEMSAAFGIAYDWFFDAFTPEQRGVIRRALIDLGLRPGLACYEANSPHGFDWTRAISNWSLVCNGGMLVGALAVGDEAPDVADPVIRHALASMPLALGQFAPDGAWAEGTGYWAYAMRYTAFAIASLQSATGDDAGLLLRAPGLDRSGFFPLYMAGPNGWTFNFSDCGEATENTIREPSRFWLAREFRQPVVAGYQAGGASEPMALLWGAGAPRVTQQSAGLPLDCLFRGAEVVSLRSGWADTNAWFAAFKAGDNAVTHSHLDIGSFVLDALGQRWILDPGADSYGLPGYFSTQQRWTYYRLRAEGHNTLVLDPGAGPDQPPRARAAIIRARLNVDAPAVVADLTSAYPAAMRVWRGLTMPGRHALVVRDELELRAPANAWWFFHTQAVIELAADGRAATLTRHGARLRVRLLAPEGARFESREARPLPTSPQPTKQNPNDGFRVLAIHLPAAVSTTLAVLFEADDRVAGTPPSCAGEPLAGWGEAVVPLPTGATASPDGSFGAALLTERRADTSQVLSVKPDHTNGVYALNEPAVWTVDVASGDRSGLAAVPYVVKRDGGDVIANGTVDLSVRSATIVASRAEPGALLAVIAAPTATKRPRLWTGGALFAPAKIGPAIPAPADFDAFWHAKLQDLAAVPPDPVVEKGSLNDVKYNDGIPYYKVTLNNIWNTQVHGQLAHPVKRGKYPALLLFQAAGVQPLEKGMVVKFAKQGFLVLNIEAHDMPIDASPNFYNDRKANALKDYIAIGIDSRDTSYFLRMVLGCVRAAEYLTSRPDWDGKSLIVSGVSQGGFQSFATAALFSKVTALVCSAPAGDDADAALARPPRPLAWPASHFPPRPDDPAGAKARTTLEYFDTIYFAARVHCPALVCTGLIDETVRPASVLATYNAIPGTNKELMILPFYDHSLACSQLPYWRRQDEWTAAVRAGQPVPPHAIPAPTPTATLISASIPNPP